jgi:hypothetical protein
MLKTVKKTSILLFCAIALAFGKMSAEKMAVEVINLSENSTFSWSISNSVNHTEFASEDYLNSDTAYMSLDSEQHFQVNLVIAGVAPQDSDLLLLQVNGAPIMLLRSDIGLGEYAYPFSTGSKEPVMKIIGGSDASIEDFPWQVYFSSGDYLCGGTIISQRWILTAAHCTMAESDAPISADKMWVKVGTATPSASNSGKWYQVKSYTIHESYDTESYENDIAVLELYENIDIVNAEIIELLDEDDVRNGAIDPGVMSTVSGWGLIRASDDPTSNDFPEVLKKVQLPIVSNATAASVWGGQPATMLMAGYENGTKDACSGDSGGPMVVDVDGEMKLAGIVSWGSEDCDSYGGFTRVSSFQDWIETHTKEVLSSPQGDLELCPETLMSTYVTSEATAGTYEWQLDPDTAGGLSVNEGTATVLWNPNYFGFVELQVRGERYGELTAWASERIELGQPPVLYSEPEDVEGCEGGVATLHLGVEGTNLTYNWYKDSVFYVSSSVENLDFNPSNILNSGAYYCIVSGICGDTTTGIFNLSIYPTTEIETISEAQDVLQGDDLSLSVSAIGHELIYQWYKDEVLITGANDSLLELKDMDANDIGLYQVVVAGTCLSDTSDLVYVYVDTNKSSGVKARIWPTVVDREFSVAISNSEVYSIEVYDFKGYLKYSDENAINQTDIDASSWALGPYVINIISPDLTASFRIIKK